jgi:hypothetical protein
VLPPKEYAYFSARLQCIKRRSHWVTPVARIKRTVCGLFELVRYRQVKFPARLMPARSDETQNQWPEMSNWPTVLQITAAQSAGATTLKGQAFAND